MIPKFRAWDKVNKKLKQVYSIDFDENGEIQSIKDEYTKPNEVYAMFEIGYFELMQSTGLKDKNGIEIYEGDIVQHSEKPNPFFSYPFKVIQARTGEWRLDNFRCGTVLAFSNQDELEVLGNIYENLELLEGE